MSATALHARLAPTRRQLLAGTGTAVLAALAGCSAFFDAVGDRLLEHVNVFNQTDRRIAGSITVVGPDGATLLEEPFDLAAQGEGGDGDQSAVRYGDVWDGAGTYEVTVELDGTTIHGTSETTESVTVEDPENEKLAAFLGGTQRDEPVAVGVGEGLSAFNATRSGAD